jgi:hypothetical protein
MNWVLLSLLVFTSYSIGADFPLVADQTPTKEAFFANLDNQGVLQRAKLCHQAKKLSDGQANNVLTKKLLKKGAIKEGDRVIMQGKRHGNQLSSLLIKTGQNRFTACFIGTKTIMDVFSDLTIVPVSEENSLQRNREKFLEGLEKVKPECLTVRLKKGQRADPEQEEDRDTEVTVHLGFKKANKDFLSRMFEAMQPYVKKDKPIVFDITGHSMGGALASHAAYYIMKKFAAFLNRPADQVAVEVVLFGAAGFFEIEDLKKASDVINADNSMVTFYRPSDYARELTRYAGFANPGYYVYFENYVQTVGTLLEFILNFLRLEESFPAIRERFDAETENHAMINYIKTIEAGIDQYLKPEEGKNALEENAKAIL